MIKKMLLALAVLFTACGRLPPGIRDVAIGARTETLTRPLSVRLERAVSGGAFVVTNEGTFNPNTSPNAVIPIFFPELEERVRITARLKEEDSAVQVEFTSVIYDSPVGHTLIFSENDGSLNLECTMPDQRPCSIKTIP
jgi:hypothetical protein